MERKHLSRQHSPSGARELDYQAHVSELARARVRPLGLVLALIIVLDGVYEAFTRPDTFAHTYWTRIAAFVACASVYVILRKPRSQRLILALVTLVVLVMAIDIEEASVTAAGHGSAFFTGLALVVAATGLLFPIEVGATLLLSAMVWVVFLVPLVLGAEHLDPHLAGDQAFFLLCATIIAAVGSRMSSKLRRSEFFGREALKDEKERSEQLLLNILPRPIAERLERGERTIADRVEDASVLFADIVGFTPLSETMTPEQLVAVLDDIFSEFDKSAVRRGLEKIKTIGDAYMVASGLLVPRGDHLEAIADMALDMRAAVEAVNQRRGLSLAMRIGIHTGPVVAGVIGTSKFSYDVWGDTVNTASRMESHSSAGEIQVTADVRQRLENDYDFSEPRSVNVKGKGTLVTSYLRGRKPAA